METFYKYLDQAFTWLDDLVHSWVDNGQMFLQRHFHVNRWHLVFTGYFLQIPAATSCIVWRSYHSRLTGFAMLRNAMTDSLVLCIVLALLTHYTYKAWKISQDAETNPDQAHRRLLGEEDRSILIRKLLNAYGAFLTLYYLYSFVAHLPGDPKRGENLLQLANIVAFTVTWHLLSCKDLHPQDRVYHLDDSKEKQSS